MHAYKTAAARASGTPWGRESAASAVGHGDDGNEQEEGRRLLQEPPVDGADGAHHPVMLDPEQADRHE